MRIFCSAEVVVYLGEGAFFPLWEGGGGGSSRRVFCAMLRRTSHIFVFYDWANICGEQAMLEKLFPRKLAGTESMCLQL